MFCASSTLRRRVELDKRFITIELSFSISLRTNRSSHWLIGQQRFTAACRNPIEPLTSHQLFQTSYRILAYKYVVPLRQVPEFPKLLIAQENAGSSWCVGPVY